MKLLLFTVLVTGNVYASLVNCISSFLKLNNPQVEWIEDKVAIIIYPGKWHSEVMVNGTLFDRSRKSFRSGRSFTEARTAAASGKNGFIAFYFKVTPDELTRLESFVRENKSASFSCIGGACRAINKQTGTILPGVLTQFPLLTAAQLAARKSRFGRSSRIANIEFITDSKDYLDLTYWGAMELIYAGSAVGAVAGAVKITLSTNDGLIDYFVPIVSQ